MSHPSASDAWHRDPTEPHAVGMDPKHCALVAIDIAAFGQRAPDVQIHLRSGLYGIVPTACDAVGVPWDGCRHEDRGDGILLIAPAEVGVRRLLDSLVAEIRTRLRTYNKLASVAAQLRLRMAVHAGYVDLDEHGASGSAVIHLFRLLEAPALKAEFALDGGDFALIVSEYLFKEVVQHGPGLIEPTAFREIPVEVKETHDRGWIWLPDARAYGRRDDLAMYGPRITRFLQWARRNGLS